MQKQEPKYNRDFENMIKKWKKDSGQKLQEIELKGHNKKDRKKAKQEINRERKERRNNFGK